MYWAELEVTASTDSALELAGVQQHALPLAQEVRLADITFQQKQPHAGSNEGHRMLSSRLGSIKHVFTEHCSETLSSSGACSMPISDKTVPQH